MDVLKLRPHHINCLFFYEGKGYSPRFIENMDRLVEHLRMHPEQKILLKEENDKVCEACPNLKKGKCISYNKVKTLDKYTLEHYKLEENEIYSFQIIKDKIYMNYSHKTFQTICKGCEWYKKRVCSEEKIIAQQKVWK